MRIQRGRLLAAALREIDERGYADTTVAHVTARSRVSRRTFYELFANREECVVALLEQGVAAVESNLAAAGLDGLPWRERMCGGLSAILAFLDREPALARVCVVHALGAGSGVLERREAILARLAAVVDEGRREGAHEVGCTPLTAEGVVGAALTIIYARLLRRDPDPLAGLAGELAGMILLPYLGKAAARREQRQPTPAAAPYTSPASLTTADPLVGIPMRLTYRTARVLEGAAERPGASNREIADYAGVRDPGQVSKLLRRLEGLGLLANDSPGRVSGEPNAWRLTSKGEQVTHSITQHTTNREQAA